jgi:23S rRNA (cytidine1920-2'-O)/16S rRNA (cytidine1409-2'-O)-methyltransferase
MPRADVLLVARGLAPSRTAAQRLIGGGRVDWLRGERREAVTRPAQELPLDADVRVAADAADRYVSRGGLKLEGALQHSAIDPSGCVCLDVGQCTGGFTDCLLQHGATRVVGIDVGHDQLHARLRDDPRVVAIEGCNARAIGPQTLGETMPDAGFALIVVDVSFISLTLVLPALPALLAGGGTLLALVKPQFEVGRAGLGKGGIVRDAASYPLVEAKIRACCREQHLAVCDYFDSPIGGSDGNREFFIWTEHD